MATWQVRANRPHSASGTRLTISSERSRPDCVDANSSNGDHNSALAPLPDFFRRHFLPLRTGTVSPHLRSAKDSNEDRNSALASLPVPALVPRGLLQEGLQRGRSETAVQVFENCLTHKHEATLNETRSGCTRHTGLYTALSKSLCWHERSTTWTCSGSKRDLTERSHFLQQLL